MYFANRYYSWSISCSLHHQVDPCLLALLPKASHGIQAAWHSHEQSSKASKSNQLVWLFLKIKDDSIHNIIIAIFLWWLIDFLLWVQILNMVAIGDLDKKRVSLWDRVDLNIDINFDKSTVLLVRIGNQMHPRNIAERGFIIRVDLLHFEPVLKQLFVHLL